MNISQNLPVELFKKSTLANLSVYGASHFLVDAICAGTIFSLLAKSTNLPELALFIVIYNILAFGLQLPLGILSDKIMKPKQFTILGILLTAVAGVLALFFPLEGIVLAGIGNALFHIGGGSISLNLTPKKASAPGIFVAPGALGLLVGTILGKVGLFNPIIFGGIAVVLIIATLPLKTPNYLQSTKEKQKFNYLELIVMLLLLTVVSRSIIGFAIVFPWKTNLLLLLALTIGVVLGKAFGGILGDKFGWTKIGVGGLIVSIPLIFLGPQYFVLGIIGMFLFNFTMPITLTALSNLFPGKPGFAFGLTCMALLIGALPFFSEIKGIFSDKILIASMIAISAIILCIGLKLSKPNEKNNFIKKKTPNRKKGKK